MIKKLAINWANKFKKGENKLLNPVRKHLDYPEYLRLIDMKMKKRSEKEEYEDISELENFISMNLTKLCEDMGFVFDKVIVDWNKEEAEDKIIIHIRINDKIYEDITFLNEGKMVALFQSLVNKLPDNVNMKDKVMKVEWLFEPVVQETLEERLSNLASHIEKKEKRNIKKTSAISLGDIELLKAGVDFLKKHISDFSSADAMLGFFAVDYLATKLSKDYKEGLKEGYERWWKSST